MSEKITEIRNKIPSITGLVTTNALNAKVTNIANKVSNTNSLVKKNDYNTNIKDIKNKIQNHYKYITITEFDKFPGEKFQIKSKHANVATTVDIADFTDNTDLDKKFENLATKTELKSKEKLQAFDSTYF